MRRWLLALLFPGAALACPPEAERLKAKAISALKGAPSQALADANEALRRCPDDPLALHIRGLAQASTGDLALAEADLAHAAELRPDPRLSRDLAEVRLGRGNAFFASQGLSEADPKDARARYLTGVALLKQSESEAAKAALDEALAQAPELAPRVQLQRGAVALSQGDIHAAREALATLDPDALPVPLRPAAQALIALADRPTSGLKTGVTTTLSAAGLYDSNALQAVEGSEDEAKADTLGASLAGRLQVVPFASERFAVFGTLDATRIQYLSEDAAALRYTGAGLSAGGRFGTVLDGREFTVSAAYEGALSLLDGGARTAPHEDLYVYSESHGLNLEAKLALSPDVRPFVRFRYADVTFADAPRDHQSKRMSLGLDLFFLERTLKTQALATVRHEDATGLGYDVEGPRGRLALSWLSPWGLEIQAQAAYERENHYNSLGYHQWEDVRVDTTLEGGLGMGYAVLPWLRLQGSGRYLDTRSTVARFEYPRTVVSLGVEVSP